MISDFTLTLTSVNWIDDASTKLKVNTTTIMTSWENKENINENKNTNDVQHNTVNILILFLYLDSVNQPSFIEIHYLHS